MQGRNSLATQPIASATVGMHYIVEVELDVEVGAAGELRSDDEFAKVALSWLESGARLVDDELYAELVASPKPWFRTPGDPDEPYGPPGAAFGSLLVSRDRGPGTRLTHARKPASAAGWRWLASQLRQRPFAAWVEMRRLDEKGYPASFINLRISNHFSAPGWLRLFRSVASTVMTPKTQPSCLGLLREFADRLDPSYGQIGVSHMGGLAETTLEHCLPQAYGRNQPWQSIVESRQWLRGYTWVTVLAREHVATLGGVYALSATGAFHEVVGLAGGGALLQATKDFHEYDQRAAERIFRVLAPVLRPGLPTSPPPGQREPFLIVYEDASAVGRPARTAHQ